MNRAIRFLEPPQQPCAAARWRDFGCGLAVCDVCDDPPITCYAKPADYADMSKKRSRMPGKGSGKRGC